MATVKLGWCSFHRPCANGGWDMERVLLTALFAGVALGIAEAGDGKKTDAEKFRGAWKVVSANETAGFEDNIDVAEYQGSVWTFADKEFTIRKDKAETKLAYALEPTKKPKQIDLGKDLA